MIKYVFKRSFVFAATNFGLNMFTLLVHQNSTSKLASLNGKIFFYRNILSLLLVVSRLNFLIFEKDIKNRYSNSKKSKNIKNAWFRACEETTEIPEEIDNFIQSSDKDMTPQALLGNI